MESVEQEGERKRKRNGAERERERFDIRLILSSENLKSDG